jgi:uncharacterized lipoprotein YmbA
MNKRIICMALICGALAVLLLAGCAGSPRTSYYSLYVPAPRSGSGSADSTLALSVGPVVVPDVLKQAKIATGGSDGRYQLSEYHRWSGEVSRDFARALAEQLAARLGTEQVAIFPWDEHLKPTCRVLIDVLNMGGEVGKEATLSVRWTLIDPQGKIPQTVRRSDFSEALADANYAAWVTAQQHNLAGLGEDIAVAVKEMFKP